MTYLCDNGAMMLAKEMTTDGTTRRHLGDEDLTAMTQLGTFAEYAVLAEESVIKIDESIPFEAASLVSCGVTTGWGSGTVGVGTQPGDTVVIVGTGGVGINAVQGARAAGANAVIAVDPVEFKRDTAKFFGATDTSPSIEEAIPLVRELTSGVMADRVVLTPSVLHAELLAPALMLTRKGGTCLMTAVPKFEVNIVPLILIDMLQSCKTAQGADLRRHESPCEHADAVVDVPQRPPQARRVDHPAVSARSDQRRVSPICAKDGTSAASSNSIKALCSPADWGCRPTGRRRVPIRGCSRTPTGR